MCQRHALMNYSQKPTLVQTSIYKVNGAIGNSHGPIGMTTCTLEFPQKFQQQFIVCEFTSTSHYRISLLP